MPNRTLRQVVTGQTRFPPSWTPPSARPPSRWPAQSVGAIMIVDETGRLIGLFTGTRCTQPGRRRGLDPGNPDPARQRDDRQAADRHPDKPLGPRTAP